MAFYLKRSIAKNGEAVEIMSLITAEILYNHLLENTQLSNENSFDYNGVYTNNYDIFTPEDVENSLLDHFIDLDDATLILSMNHITILSIFLLKHAGQISDYQILSLMKMSDGSSRLEKLLGLLLVEKQAERKRYLLYDKIEKQILAKKLGPKAVRNSYFLRYFISNGEDISSAENEWKENISSFIAGLNLDENSATLTKERVKEITKVFTDDPTSKNLTLPGVAFFYTYRCLKYGDSNRLEDNDGTYDFAIIKGNIGRGNNISLLDFVSDLPYRLYLENSDTSNTSTDTEINFVEKAKEINDKFEKENTGGWKHIFIDEKSISNTPIISDLIYDSLSQSDLDFESNLVESISEFFKKTNSLNDGKPEFPKTADSLNDGESSTDSEPVLNDTTLEVFKKYLLSQDISSSDREQLKKYYVDNAKSARDSLNGLVVENQSLDISKAYDRALLGMWEGKDSSLQTETTLTLFGDDVAAMTISQLYKMILKLAVGKSPLELLAMLALINLMRDEQPTKVKNKMVECVGKFYTRKILKVASILYFVSDRLMQDICKAYGLKSHRTISQNLSSCEIGWQTGRMTVNRAQLNLANFRALDISAIDAIPNIELILPTLSTKNEYTVFKSGQGNPPLIQPYSEMMMKRLYDAKGNVSNSCIKSALDTVFSSTINKEILARPALKDESVEEIITDQSLTFNTFYYFLILVRTFAATLQISFGPSDDSAKKYSWADYVEKNMDAVNSLKKSKLETISKDSNEKFALKQFFKNFLKEDNLAIKTLSTALAYKNYITENTHSDVFPQSVVDMFINIFDSDTGRKTLQTMTESYNDILANVEADGRIKVGLSKAELLFLKQDLTNLISNRESIQTSLNITNGPSLLTFQYAMAFLQFYSNRIGEMMDSLQETVDEDDTSTSYYQSNPASLEGIVSEFNNYIKYIMAQISDSSSKIYEGEYRLINNFAEELLALNKIQQFYDSKVCHCR